tara:strand:- start:1506 stop:2450 length:945 start_codon:yes stop_codon:yes gene_type:complete
MKIFITGQAGMIGFHSALAFKNAGWDVKGLDNFNDYYDVKLKQDRATILREEGIETLTGDIQNFTMLEDDVKDYDCILHLAAYANPRHALAEPQPYIDTNITGTQRIVEVAENHDIPVVYASSSCVMHGQPLPWNEHDRPLHQNNPYGWSKRANECQFMHSKLSRSAGLRFFTVYGPYGRPDMALFSFTDSIVAGKPIELYNYGDMKRDFTFVDDIVQGIELVVDEIVESNETYHEIYNIGHGTQVELVDFVDEIEKNLGRKTERLLVAAHPADTPETWSDTTKLRKLGYVPTTPVPVGVEKFITWYKEYYGVN